MERDGWRNLQGNGAGKGTYWYWYSVFDGEGRDA